MLRNSTSAMEPTEKTCKSPTSGTRFKWISLAVLILGLVCLIAGVTLIVIGIKHDKCPVQSVPAKGVSLCDYSDEARRVGFDKFLDKVVSTVYKLHPYNIAYEPHMYTVPREVAIRRVKAIFKAYDPSPSTIKEKTDIAWKLHEELNTLKINQNKLKTRERKAYAQVKHYLRHMFGQPYDTNYYSGDWMLGPSFFCIHAICFLDYNLYNTMLFYAPKTLKDVEDIRTMLQTYSKTFDVYIDNMKLGIKKGMVRNTEACVAGYDSMRTKFNNISLYNETGVLKEWYTQRVLRKEYYRDLPLRETRKWKQMHNKYVNESIKEYLVEFIGKPILRMLRYLKEDHLPHCVPSSVSSGLGGLPVKYVYTNGVANKSQPTDPSLPLTDRVLDGKKTYEMTMSYFTTNDMTPDEVHQLGWDMLNKLYPKVIEIAKQITKIDNDTAVAEFRKLLNASESYFNEKTIPQNESDENAHRKCSELKGAKKYCPKRWEAIQIWFKEARKVMSMLDPKIVNMFYFTGSKHTTPNCPIDLQPNLNPSSGAQSYEASNRWCGHSATYYIPFFLERMGPRYSEWSVNAHEARPGHHLQVQGSVENFQDRCGGSIGWLDSETYYTAFTEGWALYAENPLIAEDTNTYANEPLQKFGMLKWQIWRAIRLIVDTGLHYKGMSRAEALKLFEEKAWDGTDLAEKEVTRYQSNPGQATAYMIGQLDIKKARKYASSNLKKDFNLKDFHYQVLSQGSSPLGYLSDHIKRYVECRKDSKKSGCTEILYSPKKTSSKKAKSRLPLRPPKRHYI